MLAENISAPSSPKGPSKKAPVIMPPPSPLRDAGKGGLGGRAESKFGGGGGGRGAKGGYDEDDDGYSDVHLHPRGRGVRDSYEAEEEQYGGGGEMTEEEAAVDALSRTVQVHIHSTRVFPCYCILFPCYSSFAHWISI